MRKKNKDRLHKFTSNNEFFFSDTLFPEYDDDTQLRVLKSLRIDLQKRALA